MAFVITRLCRDCVDASCVAVCPTDCIVRYRGPEDPAFPNQLFVAPDDCIDCGLCEAECPWEAIRGDVDVPEAFAADVALNAVASEKPELFEVPDVTQKPRPTPAKVAANKRRWGLGEDQ